MPSSGIIFPCFWYHSQLQGNWSQRNSMPYFDAAASSTRMPSGTTSLPIPSPGMTAMRCFAICLSLWLQTCGWVTTTSVPAETPYFSSAPTCAITCGPVRLPASSAA